MATAQLGGGVTGRAEVVELIAALVVVVAVNTWTVMSGVTVWVSIPLVPMIRTVKFPLEAPGVAVIVNGELAALPETGTTGDVTVAETPAGAAPTQEADSDTGELNPLIETTTMVAAPFPPGVTETEDTDDVMAKSATGVIEVVILLVVEVVIRVVVAAVVIVRLSTAFGLIAPLVAVIVIPYDPIAAPPDTMTVRGVVINPFAGGVRVFEPKTTDTPAGTADALS